MQVRSRLIASGLGLGFGCLALAGAPAFAAVPLMAHKATYRLVLDGSKPTGQLEDMRGEIQYEITGDACAGFTTFTRQTSKSTTGDGESLAQEVTSKAWEDGEGKSYRFNSTSRSASAGNSEVEADVTRDGPDALKVVVTKPKPATLSIPGKVLMPTEHVGKVIAAGTAGDRVLQAKVYDGSSDPARIYETLTVIGRATTNAERAPAVAREQLGASTYFPVTVSYYEPGATSGSPEYVMSFALYDNGVVGDMKIDYGKFALVGTMAEFTALKPAEGCPK
ncbi:cell envelope integrity EipB family protein [Xanthobacter tagetidis]|uniref:DUF1849 family protein n=1 Tax=Xanthobacter tagetidis TaxID=60216 RepID=A0A3L7A9V6_9HYPH|nr:cell envelope integrity EipB family protein [Xanthobacter tagetidis]MBB6309663.1 hypothetical protein [Xanthobacter tagetidis]RLP77206.1 DUF1849 family protein [Xanthobacter tagetidis]